MFQIYPKRVYLIFRVPGTQWDSKLNRAGSGIEKNSGSGRVSGTRWAPLVTVFVSVFASIFHSRTPKSIRYGSLTTHIQSVQTPCHIHIKDLHRAMFFSSCNILRRCCIVLQSGGRCSSVCASWTLCNFRHLCKVFHILATCLSSPPALPTYEQSCKMSNFLHRSIFSKWIYSQEKARKSSWVFYLKCIKWVKKANFRAKLPKIVSLRLF